MTLSKQTEQELSGKLKAWAICLFLILCPIAFTPQMTDIRVFQEHFYQVSAIVLISLFIGNLWISAFILWNLYLFIHNGAQVGSMQVGNIIFGALLFRFTRNYFKKESFTPYFKVFVGISLLSMLWMVLQHFGIDPIFIGKSANNTVRFGQSYNDPTGLFALKAANAIYLSVALPAVLTVCPILAALFVPALVACRSSAAALGLLFAIPFYLWNRFGRKVGLIATSVMAIGAASFFWFDLKDDSMTFNSRFPHWHQVVRFSLLHSQGYGPDSFRNHNKHKNFEFVSDRHYNPATLYQESDKKMIWVPYYTNEGHKKELNTKDIMDSEGAMQINKWQEAHNEYIQAFFEYGIFGLLLIIGFIAQIIRRFYFATKTLEVITLASMIAVFLLTSVTQFPFHLARLGFMFPILLGVFFSKTEK